MSFKSNQHAAVQAGVGTVGRWSLLTFFCVTFALTIPFWAVGAATDRQWLPGVPAAALSFVCPGLAALLLAYHGGGFTRAKSLSSRAVDYDAIGSMFWYAPLLLISPAISVLSFVALRALGTPVPVPHIALVDTLTLFALFIPTAICEELGWSGYALDPLQARWGTLRASLLLGAAWAAWHWPPLLQLHRSVEWIAWWTLWTMSARVIMTWLYNRTGNSVFGASLYHAVSNVCWQLFPIHTSFWDPRITGLLTALVAVALTFAGHRLRQRPLKNRPRTQTRRRM